MSTPTHDGCTTKCGKERTRTDNTLSSFEYVSSSDFRFHADIDVRPTHCMEYCNENADTAVDVNPDSGDESNYNVSSNAPSSESAYDKVPVVMNQNGSQ